MCWNASTRASRWPPAGSNAASSTTSGLGRGAFILNRDVVTGQVFAPTCGATRTKADFVEHIRRTIATDPTAARWHFAVEDLDIHRCEPLIRLMAELSRDGSDLGVMGKSGVLASRASRVAYLTDSSVAKGTYSTIGAGSRHGG
jgi:hypothetical protein